MPTPSYRYWTLNPDQAAVDARKSPGDPIVAVKTMARVGSSAGPKNCSEERRESLSWDEHEASTSNGAEQNRRVRQRLPEDGSPV